MSQLSKIFGGGDKRDAMGEANEYLNQIPGAAGQYYDPFIERGGRAGNELEDALSQLMSDPNAFLEKLMGGYETSGDYSRKKDILGRELGSTAAAGGVAGTPMHQQQQAEMIDSLLSSDMQQYLANVLGLFDRGMKGEQDFFNKGFDASGRMADTVGNTLSSQAGLAFEDAKTSNANRNNLISSLTQALATGAGYMLGGPAGGMMAGSIAGPMSGSSVAPWKNPG